MKLGLSLGYAPPGHEPGRSVPARAGGGAARLRLGLGRRGLGNRRGQRPRLARGEDGEDQARLRDHADPRPHAREHGDDGRDARPPLRRPLPARARHVRAAGGRGLARAAVGEAARQDARVRRDRPHGAAPRGRRARGRALPDPVGRPGRDRPRQAAEADAPPAARRDPDLPRRARPEERRARGRDRRRLAADLRRARAIRRRLRAEPRGRAAGLRDRRDGERPRRRRRGRAPRRAHARTSLSTSAAWARRAATSTTPSSAATAGRTRPSGSRSSISTASSARRSPLSRTSSSTPSALVGPKERIAERLEAWRETPVTTLVLGTTQPEALQTLAELVL